MSDPRDAGPDGAATAASAGAPRTVLQEVDHRVKNNPQLIASMILLQSRRCTDPATRQALKTALERVTAVATVHRRLFQDVSDAEPGVRATVTIPLAKPRV
jgi:two-component sensor histidine kinase